MFNNEIQEIWYSTNIDETAVYRITVFQLNYTNMFEMDAKMHYSFLFHLIKFLE